MQPFIFQPGNWLGQGQITFNDSPSIIQYYTKWIVREADEGVHYCEQRVERQGIKEPLCNLYKFSVLIENAFLVELESSILGSISGQGSIENRNITWEFKNPTPFEDTLGFSGYEKYIIQENDKYLLRAEYCSGEHITKIEGHLWRKD